MTNRDELLERLQTALAGRYRIERELGSGGMAHVYLAEDLKHRSQVAIKVLKPEIANSIGPERFVREIEILARLNHPHILPLRDSGLSGDLPYFITPFAEGAALRDRLERERQLPIGDAVRIATDVARALEFAHQRGVVHRDIKPDNILLQDGIAVVADFGIARAVSSLVGTMPTETGFTLGTPQYMSPEQSLASKVDGRSDVYSLACVTYEMLAGQPPFTGPDAFTVEVQHRSAPPPDVRRLRPSVPVALASAISRALAKAPADRFETARAFANALTSAVAPEVAEATTVPAAPLPIPGTPSARAPAARAVWGRGRARAAIVLAAVVVAVPALVWWLIQMRGGCGPASLHPVWVIVAEFDAPPDDPDLAEVGRTLVAASFDASRAFATVPNDQIRKGLELAGKPDSSRMTPELACELAERGVPRHGQDVPVFRAAVTGQIVKAGGGYAVVLRALDPHTCTPLYTENGNASSADDLLRTLGAAAGRLRRALGENVRRSKPEEPIEPVATPSLEAYQLYARGIRAARKGELSLALFQEAVGVDSSFAAAWMEVAFALINERSGTLGARMALQRALRHPERLTPKQQRSAEAALALNLYDFPSALKAYELMLQLEPDDLDALAGHAYALAVCLGRHEEALADYQRQEQLSPFGPDVGLLWNQMVTLQILGRLQEARAIIPRIPGPMNRVARLQDAFWSGEWPRAIEIAAEIESDHSIALRDRVIALIESSASHAAMGHLGPAFAALDRMDEMVRQSGFPGRMWDARYRLASVSGEPRGIDRILTNRVAALPPVLASALCHAEFGDTSYAKVLLGQLKSYPTAELKESGAALRLIEAEIAARGGRWEQVVALLREPALQGEGGLVHFGATQPFLCWRMADAFEGLGAPDSAIAYLERSLPHFGGGQVLPSATSQSAFTRRRLVLLNAKLGRIGEARRHLNALLAQIDSTDAEARALTLQPTSVVAAAEAMERTGSP